MIKEKATTLTLDNIFVLLEFFYEVHGIYMWPTSQHGGSSPPALVSIIAPTTNKPACVLRESHNSCHSLVRSNQPYRQCTPNRTRLIVALSLLSSPQQFDTVMAEQQQHQEGEKGQQGDQMEDPLVYTVHPVLHSTHPAAYEPPMFSGTIDSR